MPVHATLAGLTPRQLSVIAAALRPYERFDLTTARFVIEVKVGGAEVERTCATHLIEGARLDTMKRFGGDQVLLTFSRPAPVP